MILSKTNDITEKLEKELSRNRDVLKTFPLQQYMEHLDAYPRVVDYNKISDEVKKICGNIIEFSDLETLEIYHRLLLCNLLKKSVARLEKETLPEEIKNLYFRNFCRILENVAEPKEEGEYLYSNDKFKKELSISCLRLIPAGARKINLSALPIKNFMFKKGFRQLWDVMFYVCTELRGIKPMYASHLDTNDPDLLAELNREGLKKTYFRIVDLLKIQKDVKGYFGTSWWLDPQLDQINSRHRYNRELVTKNGGKLYYRGPCEVALKNALAKSETRRRLYEEGKYVPTNYVVVWSRQKLMRWAETIRRLS